MGSAQLVDTGVLHPHSTITQELRFLSITILRTAWLGVLNSSPTRPHPRAASRILWLEAFALSLRFGIRLPAITMKRAHLRLMYCRCFPATSDLFFVQTVAVPSLSTTCLAQVRVVRMPSSQCGRALDWVEVVHLCWEGEEGVVAIFFCEGLGFRV